MENLMTIAASKLFCGVAQEEVAALLASANARWRSCAQGEVILLAGSRASSERSPVISSRAT